MYYLWIFLLLFVPSVCVAAPDWTYDADYTGQEEWGNLQGYELCGNGANQSPITISYTKNVIMPPLEFAYNTTKYELKTSDKSFVINLKKAGKITADGIDYSLQRIEFHSPSEHIIGEKYYPLEIHLLHKNANGGILIVAVFAGFGEGNAALAHNKLINPIINPSDLLPKSRGYYSYTGSISYPPCTEGVKWRIMKSPITISKAQLAEITKIVGRNSRLPQPTYMREILESN